MKTTPVDFTTDIPAALLRLAALDRNHKLLRWMNLFAGGTFTAETAPTFRLVFQPEDDDDPEAALVEYLGKVEDAIAELSLQNQPEGQHMNPDHAALLDAVLKDLANELDPEDLAAASAKLTEMSHADLEKAYPQHVT